MMPDVDQVIRRSATATPRVTTNGSGAVTGDPYGQGYDDAFGFWTITQFADDISPWGIDIRTRDLQLRQFLPTANLILSAFTTVAARNAAFAWTFDGGDRLVSRAQRLLQESNLGGGWRSLMIRLTIDLLSQDNGAFVEVVKERDSADSRTIGLLNLDAGRCWRTGDPRNPVLYTAQDGTYHLLPWYRVMLFEEMPSAIERLRGLQYSALTRILTTAQIYRDMQQYVREKVSGRNPSSLTFVGGVGRKELEDAQARMNATADNEGRYRYGGHVMIPGLSPERSVSVETVDFKSIPDGFDAADEFNRLIDSLAMALLIDRQDLAPLTGGNLGTSTQSEVLSRKTRGKGPALFQKMIEDKFNFFGIFGQGVTFRFEEQDAVQEREEAEARKIRADVYKVYYDMGMPANTIWQMMADSGDLDEEYLALMGQSDVTDDVTVTDEEPAENQAEVTAEAAVDSVVETNPLAAIRAEKPRVRTAQHDAMDDVERDAQKEFGAALQGARDSFVAAVKRQLPKQSPVVAEMKAIAEAQAEREDRLGAVVAGAIEHAVSAQRAIAEAQAERESTLAGAIQQAASTQRSALTEVTAATARQHAELSKAIRDLASPRKRTIIRDEQGRAIGSEEIT